MKILSLITHSFQSRKTFVHLRNTNFYICDEIWELSDPNDRNEIHRRSKDIDKTVHVTSVDQPQLYEPTKILFSCKENKNNFFLTILLPELRLPPFRRVPKNVIAVTSVVYALGKARVCVAILSKMEEGGLLNSLFNNSKIHYFCFHCTQNVFA